MNNSRSPLVALLLEAIPGFFFQTFGIGHIYTGRVGLGLAVMLSYWLLLGVNVVLMGLLIGFLTTPLTFLAYIIISSMVAAGNAESSR